MKRGKYEAPYVPKRNSSKKALAVMLSFVLVIGCVAGGTLAWLTAESGEVKNVFTTSDINVELKEHTYDPATNTLTGTETTTGVDNYKMIPGWTIPKDPWAEVSENSEDCYLFVKIEGENAGISKNVNGTYTLGNYIVYAVDNGWSVLDETNYPNVFYKVIDESTEKNAVHNILGAGEYIDADNVTYTWNTKEVLTKPEVTKEMMNAFDTNKDGSLSDEEQNALPTLTFTAYAHQLYKSKDVTFDVTTAWNNVSNK